MDINQLKERMDIFVSSSVVSTKAADITTLAFMNLQSHLKKDAIDRAEMLFTHLPTALTRIEKGEQVEAPHPALLEEVKQSPEASTALKEIDFIQQQWKNQLPQEEIDFLLIHYTNVLQINKGGI
ncbi:PRD domain-containing protein [Cytobacillus firmus]|uniref:PRD domain-containing protein n=1 Tax=Cytobacillus firmus TaxID=1399 RepID=UPI0021897C4A|nr:PRD domain-containing protein [Cytobacillus firmus]URM33346.1 PRD domain-containing protein [Cytobacillus firmus]